MDQKLLFLINREWTSTVADRVMATASSWDVWLPIAALLIALFLIRGHFRERAYVAVLIFIVGFNDGVVSHSLKRLIGRPRPHQALADVRVVDLQKARPRLLAVLSPVKVKMSRRPDLDQRIEGRSFPSSHTINMFSVALVTVAFYGLAAAWTFAIAALVSYSRMYVGVHYPSDVITSIFLGIGSSLLLLAALEHLWRRHGDRWLPAIHSRHPSLFSR